MRRRTRRRYSREYVETASGVAWFDREQWQRLRSVAADPERLEESYELGSSWRSGPFTTLRRPAW
jgi:hypothetical protein